MQPSIAKPANYLTSEYILMHADETVATANRESNSVDVKLPAKLPFSLRNIPLDYTTFVKWLINRTNNQYRVHMSMIYKARRTSRKLDNILRDSCALSVTDQFRVKIPDTDTIIWRKLQEQRDQNEALINLALTGYRTNLDYKALLQGFTSLFTLKGSFPKAIRKNTMLKCSGTQEREWITSVIGKALNISVQNAVIISPDKPSGHDDTLVSIDLFTDENNSLVHASEFFANDPDRNEACAVGRHHRYFYDRLPSNFLKREFERVLILNWLISNHDMHGENFGCLYDPKTFEIKRIAPSFDHNCADFDGMMPDFDVPDIVIPALRYHSDIIDKIKSGELDTAVKSVGEWLTDEQRLGIKTVGQLLTKEFDK